MIRSGFSLFNFKTKQDMNILSKGSLLGDKITTMALGTIGLKPTRQTEIAKQIYDIGTLLKTVTKSDLQMAFEMFESMTNFKVSHDQRYNISDISRSIADRVF